MRQQHTRVLFRVSKVGQKDRCTYGDRLVLLRLSSLPDSIELSPRNDPQRTPLPRLHPLHIYSCSMPVCQRHLFLKLRGKNNSFYCGNYSLCVNNYIRQHLVMKSGSSIIRLPPDDPQSLRPLVWGIVLARASPAPHHLQVSPLAYAITIISLCRATLYSWSHFKLGNMGLDLDGEFLSSSSDGDE